MKKIVLISGSPRREGNTSRIHSYLISELSRGGADVTVFNAAKDSVSPCLACDTCFRTGAACTHDPVFSKIANTITEADVVIFSTPVYWYSMSSQLKSVIDKLYSFEVGECMPTGKDCVLVACASEGAEAFSVLRQEFDYIIGYLSWNKIGELFIPEVTYAGDIDQTDYMNIADTLISRILQEK